MLAAGVLHTRARNREREVECLQFYQEYPVLEWGRLQNKDLTYIKSDYSTLSTGALSRQRTLQFTVYNAQCTNHR